VIGADLRTLLRLLRGHPRRGSQAHHYDAFCERLLPGRRALIERLAVPAGARVVELGGGTGRNLAFFGPRLAELERFDLVDLCPALLEQARKRTARLPNVYLAALVCPRRGPPTCGCGCRTTSSWSAAQPSPICRVSRCPITSTSVACPS